MKQRSLLDRIFEPGGLTIVLQPIFRYRQGEWHRYAFEALGRGPRGTNLESADVLFEYVRRKGREALIDRTCATTALRAITQLDGDARLGLNVHASTLEHDDGFVGFLTSAAQMLDFSLSRLTIEIVEQSPCGSGHRLGCALDGLRDHGVLIAVDDIGLGHSNYRMILECKPDFFKVDRYLVKGSSMDSYRRAVLRSIANLAENVGAMAVAEGIDNQADLDTVQDEGFDMAQGFLMSRPQDASEFVNTDTIFCAA